MMKRDQCFRALARHMSDEVVVATYSSAVDWLELGERALNYFSVGAMGLDSSHALGLALGRPDRRIICLQGDGSLLMNLGCLVTIAAAAPKNLVHIVVQNGTYEANGSHPIPNARVEFAAMARAAGYAHVHEFSELANFEQQAAHVLKQDRAGIRHAPRRAFEAAHLRLCQPLRSGAARGAQSRCGRASPIGSPHERSDMRDKSWRRKDPGFRSAHPGYESPLSRGQTDVAINPATSPRRLHSPAPPTDTRPRARSTGCAAASDRPRSSAAACARRYADNAYRADAASPRLP
jgi:Thiamine pyrophosphate enzyme, C-terminal TPP binding domain